VAWCEKCHHNADPQAPEDKTARAARRRATARKRGERLFAELSERDELDKPGSALRALGVTMALGVHLLSLALLIGSLTLMISVGSVPAFVLGCIGIIIAVWAGPRVQRGPRGKGWLRRAEAPALFGVLDRVCAELGAPVPVAVGRDGDFNAYTLRTGLRGKPVVVIGLPLWRVATGPERLALLGHEIGHTVNGDTLNGMLGYAASRSLATWRMVFHPGNIRTHRVRGRGSVGMTHALAELLAPLILLPLYLCFFGLEQLHARIWQQLSPRAEYHADALAGRLAGRDALVSLIEKLACGSAVSFVLTQRTGTARDRRERLRDYLRTMPEHERQRQLVVSESRGTSVDATHPPTYLRRSMALRMPRRPAALTVSDEEWRRIDVELGLIPASMLATATTDTATAETAS
jgi:Zn-dependent protease with chaperone function